MKTSLGDTLTKLRKDKKLMQKGLASKLSEYGFSVAPKTIYNWEKGLSQPSIPHFLALCDILDVDDVLWQFAGISKGPYAGLNSEGRSKARDFIDILRRVDMYKVRETQPSANVPLALVSETQPSADRAASTPDATLRGSGSSDVLRFSTGLSDDAGNGYAPRVLRLYDIPVSAGTGNFLDDSGYEDIEAPPYVPIAVDFALRLSGDSMEPLLTDGQVIWVKEQDVLESGDIGIFTYSDNVYCKKLIADGKKAFLRSLNPLYGDIEVKEDFGFKVLGKVLC